jgi:RNA 2',3'-cyclic 3'-phosphodiesterase
MRLFVAADLPAELRARLAALQHDLRGLRSDVRWVRPERIHLTFVFLGEVAADRLAPIRGALEAAAGEAPAPFRLRAAGVGAFPDRGSLRVVWVGIEGDGAAAARLRNVLGMQLARCGHVAEEREFRPHLTLGRVRQERGREDRAFLERHRSTDLGEFPVDAVILFESRLGPQGAQYTALARFPLGSAP